MERVTRNTVAIEETTKQKKKEEQGGWQSPIMQDETRVGSDDIDVPDVK